MDSKETVLVVDIGSTKIAACLVRLDGKTEAVSSIAHEADLASSPDYSEQDAPVIMENLKEMLPRDVWARRSRLVGSGNALQRTPLLQEMAAHVFGMPLKICDHQEEAAYGAAINALSLINPHFPDELPDLGMQFAPSP